MNVLDIEAMQAVSYLQRSLKDRLEKLLELIADEGDRIRRRLDELNEEYAEKPLDHAYWDAAQEYVKVVATWLFLANTIVQTCEQVIVQQGLEEVAARLRIIMQDFELIPLDIDESRRSWEEFETNKVRNWADVRYELRSSRDRNI